MVLNELGSIASIVGLPLSLVALVFAIYHLLRLRGETRAAREAAEAAQQLLRRDLTIGDITRLRGRIRHLIDLNRRGDKVLSLSLCQDIQELFLDVQWRHPNLKDESRQEIHRALGFLVDWQSDLEDLIGDIPAEMVSRFNSRLNGLQIDVLVMLENDLP